MEEIIKKAIEGGYKVNGHPLRWNEKTKSLMYPMILDPLFWQSLGKACGWEGEEIRMHLGERGISSAYFGKHHEYIYQATKFHIINLTEGWDKAVEYLTETIRGTALVN